VLHILFAGPDDFDRRAHGLRGQHGVNNEVGDEPPPEPTAKERPVNPDLLFRKTQDLRDDELRELLALSRRPHLAPVGCDVCRAVHRLHRRVCEKLRLVVL
jgi:hypothetical protein